MTNDISKELPEQFTDKFFIYNGTDSIEEMVENIERLSLEKSKCYFIKLGDWFYAVFIQGYDKIVVGREKVYYTKNGRMVESSIAEANIGYEIDSKNVRFITDTLARELNVLYNPIEIYEFPTIKSKEYHKVDREDLLLSNYVVILGVTFASRFYTLDDADKMGPYFIHTPELTSFLRRTKGAVAIDPFSNLIKFKDGKIGAFSYQPTNRDRYNRYSSNIYRDGTPKAVFALQEQNIYSPFRKREWISLTRYMALYPDDNMNHQKPDFREDKNTCKWCGDSLLKGKKSYCSVDCRLEFDRAVNLERGATVPYLIMCRDRFICQTCGKNMAKVNEHGLKLPIPYLHKKPDRDGKQRSEAEVDHIIAVEDGGNDHQSNLATICQDCHKKKHKKRKTKAEKEAIATNVVSLDQVRRKKESDNKGNAGFQTEPLATPKQLPYLESLAKKNGCVLRNTHKMTLKEASKLIRFFLYRSGVEEEILREYIVRHF